MIQITINDIIIPLQESSVRFEYINNLFNENFIQGDYTFPFLIPETVVVNKAFKFANALDAVGKIYDFDCILLYKRQVFIKGKVFINGYSNRAYSVNVAFGIKGNSFIDKKISDYDFGGVITPPNLMDFAKATATTNNWKVHPLCFIPHYNPNFYGGSNDDFNGVVNKFDIYTKEYFSNSSTNNHCLVPWFYLFYILTHIAEIEGYDLRGSFMENKDASKITIYNNYALDLLEDFYTVYIEKSNNQSLLGISQYINFMKTGPEDIDKDNRWQPNNSAYLISATGNYNIDIKLNYNGGFVNTASWPALVNFKIVIEIDGVDSHIEYMNINNLTYPSGFEHEKYIFYSFNAGPALVGKTIRLRYDLVDTLAIDSINPVIVRPESYIFIINNDTIGVNVYEKTINPKNHMPSDTVGEFLNNLKQAFGLLIDINPIDKLIKIDFNKKSLAKIPEKDITSKALKDFIITIDNEEKGFNYGYAVPSDDDLCQDNFKKFELKNLIGKVLKTSDLGPTSLPGKIKYVKSNNKYYITSESGGSLVWQYLSDRCDEFIYGNGASEVKSKYMPMLMNVGSCYDSDASSDVSVLMPHILQTGSSPAFGTGISEATPRLMFNHGLRSVSGSLTKKYVFSSSMNYDQDGVKVSDFNLMPGDEDGLHELFTRLWLQILMGKETIECDFLYDFIDILGFSTNEPVYFFNQKYILKTATVEISSSIKPFKMYLVKYNG